MDYGIDDLMRILKNIKNNPYGIKEAPHAFDRAQKRGIDLNMVTQFLNDGIPVGIQKTFNDSMKFELLYEYSKFSDLSIVINIWDEEDIEVVTVIEKESSRRKH